MGARGAVERERGRFVQLGLVGAVGAPAVGVTRAEGLALDALEACGALMRSLHET
jgi:hypothetical protein